MNVGVMNVGVYDMPLALQCIYKHSDERGENGDGEGREWRLTGLLYADDLAFMVSRRKS